MKYATLHTVVFLLLLLLGSGVAGARKKKTPVEQISAEQAFMEKNFSQIPCREWATGRTFIYLDNTLSPLLQPQYPLLPDSSLRGKLFVFCGFTDASMWGGGTMDIVFECEGTRYYYKTGKTLDDIKNTAYAPLLPMPKHRWKSRLTARTRFRQNAWISPGQQPLRARMRSV